MTSTQAAFDFDGARWTRVKVLGKGSFGEAVLFRRADSDHLAVCKRVALAQMKPQERKDAVNEVNMLAKLRHPNIVAYLGSFEKDDTLHILMEYANAGDVDGLIKAQKAKGKPLPEETVGTLFVQLAHAIKYLHERRILHRDLKAQNVFLSRRKNGGPLVVKLGDFGIATVLRNSLALAKTQCGTPYYFSPELCLNKPYNNKTDIWSLGCILYEMSTLKHAFDANSMKALVARILKGTYSAVPSCYPAELQRLIDAMLQQKASSRHCIQQVLGAPWVSKWAGAMLAQSDSMYKTITGNLKLSDLHAAGGGAAAKPAVSGGGARATDPRSQLAKAAQAEVFKARASDLQKLDDARERAERQTYEEQQKLLQQAKQVMHERGKLQGARMQGYAERDVHLDNLRKQMEDVDRRMREQKERDPVEEYLNGAPSAFGGASPGQDAPAAAPQPYNRWAPKRDLPTPPSGHAPRTPPHLMPQPAPAGNPSAAEMARKYKDRGRVGDASAPWNRDRVPVGFTPESWEAHQAAMAGERDAPARQARRNANR